MFVKWDSGIGVCQNALEIPLTGGGGGGGGLAIPLRENSMW